MQFSQHLAQLLQTDKHNRPDALNLRLHRAFSWLSRAEASTDDLDIQFVTLWISFNAIYAREFVSERSADRVGFSTFLNDVCRLDQQGQLYDLVWQKYSGSIRIMLQNRYVFQPFWDFQNGKISEDSWQADFDKANRKARTALQDKDTHAMLLVIFERLYTLRNQIVHGGSTWNSSVNRQQLKDGCQILLSVIPAIIRIMLQHPTQDWGKPFYPVISE